MMLLRRFHAGDPPPVAFDDHSAGLGVPNRDFGYDEGWAEIFASTAPGGAFVEAPVDDGDGYAEQFALSDVDSGRNHQRTDSPLQPDLTRSSFSGDSDSSSYISDDEDYDSDGDPIFRLQLPVTSPLARRRYVARGEDLKCVGREQRFQAEYDVARRRGEITEPGDLFREIDWNQQHSAEKTEEVSPRTLPQTLRAPGRKNAVVLPSPDRKRIDALASWANEWLGSQIEAQRQTQNDEIHSQMRDTAGFQSFPSSPRLTPYSATNWDDDLVVLDADSEMQMQAENEYIYAGIQNRLGYQQFPSPLPRRNSESRVPFGVQGSVDDMRASEGFQSFPSPQPAHALFTASWDDELVVLDTRSELQREAQNEEIHQWVLSRAREMQRQAQEGPQRFPSPPPYEWIRNVTSDDLFDGGVEYL